MSSDPTVGPEAAAESQALPQPTPVPEQDTSASSLPDDIRQQVEQEQALADAQRKVKSLEEEVEKVKAERQTLVNEKDGVISVTNQLRTQLSSLQSSHHKSTSELSVLQTRIDAIEREKKELFEETERLQQRSSKNTQELYALRAQKTEASQKIAHLDVEVSELRMTTETAKFNEKRSSQALQSARAEILNLSKAVADVEERFGKYRADKQAEQSQARTEHEAVLTRLNTVENSYRSLQRTYNDQSKRLAEAHAHIATLTSAAAAKKASVSLEFHQLSEENRILEKRGDDARATTLEREAELERVVNAYEDKEKGWEEKWKKEERTRRDAEKRAEDLKTVVERLALAGGEGTNISSAATLASDLKQSGKSYTQFYTDYTIQEGKLRAAENEVARLTGLLDEISQDISEKKPLLDEQAAEHARAIDRANALAAELASVISAREAHEAEAKNLRAAATHNNEEVSALQNNVDDLSRQIQNLLRQLAIKDDPSLAGVTLDGTATVEEGDIITDHLLEFRSIRSLQEQNLKLLRLTRNLMSKLDQREIRRAEDSEEDVDTGASLDQATETITKLHAQLLEVQKKVNEATRERDFFSKLLAKGEGLRWKQQQEGSGPFEDGIAPHQQTIATLQAELDVIRSKADNEVTEAKEQIRLKAEQLGIAEVDKAKADAKVGLLEEQLRMLNEAGSLQKQEYISLETQHRQLQGAVAQAHSEQKSALEQAASRQAEADRFRNETALLRAEKEQWKSTESRLQSDFAQVQSERVKLQQLIDNLKNVASEAERSRTEERSQLEKRIDDLGREATALRGQIDQAREATRAAEKRVEDFDGRLASATTSVRAEKEAVEALAKTRAEEISTLTTEIERLKQESENRYRIGINWKRRADALTESQTSTQQSHATAVADKDKEIADINKKIGDLSSELEIARSKLTEAERVSALKENTVQRLQSELSKAQTAGQAAAPPAQSDNAALIALQSEKDALQQKLAQAENDLELAKSAASITVAAVAPADTSAPSDDQTADLASKVEQLEKEKEEFNQRYEANVSRVNRTNSAMKARLDALTQEKATAQATVDTLQARVIELEQTISDLKAGGAAPAEGGGSTQAAIDDAVKAAVSAREAELQAEHAKALEAASSFTASIGELKPDVDSLQAKKAELDASFETRVSEAVKAQYASLQAEAAGLKGQVEQLTTKVKALERQVKTAEISRKTLERQKAEVEKKLEAAAGGAPGSAPTPTPAVLSGTAGDLKPSASAGPSQPAPAASSSATTQAATAQVTTPAATSSAGAPAVRGNVRGRARGAVRGATRGAAPGRPNPVLSAVNATLAQATPTPTTNPTSPTGGVKRPLPEDGEVTEGDNAPSEDILTRIQGAASAGPVAGGERGRVLKRPRGAATRGGRGGRGGGNAGAAGASGGTSGEGSGPAGSAPGGAAS
ncbi:hypothetical protein IAR55_001395 [Kwoniella newhampshirensis]|uniref:NUA/TPR/MLP1-2-like domain-containing protein n=1 Tax=Kwoniella newhampshirensis TaxID=1651941 RepID=A0AAW0Z277_9TREE